MSEKDSVFGARRRGRGALAGALVVGVLVLGLSAPVGIPGSLAAAIGLPSITPSLPLPGSPSPVPSPSAPPSPSPSPSPLQPVIQIDAGHPGVLYSPYFSGVDAGFGTSWDSATGTLFPAPAGKGLSTAQALSSLHLGTVRYTQPVNLQYCSGGGDCTFHWWDFRANTLQPPKLSARSDSPGPDDFEHILATTTAGAVPMLNVNIEKGKIDAQGRPVEAVAWVAYMNGGTTDTTPVDATTTVGSWAKLRADNRSALEGVRDPNPYGIRYWEIGNEEYSLTTVAGWSKPPACATGSPSNGALYGCTVKVYAQAMRAVDPTIKIVAGSYDPTFTRDMLAAAADPAAPNGNWIDAIDFHAYDASFDASTTTFTHDLQSATYSVDPGVAATPQTVTYALWLDGIDDTPARASNINSKPVVNVWFDGTQVQTSIDEFGSDVPDNTVIVGAGDLRPRPLTFQALTGPGSHQIQVVACSGASAVGETPPNALGYATGGTCQFKDHHPLVDLRHIRWELGAQSASAMGPPASPPCFYVDPGTLVDTTVAPGHGQGSDGTSTSSGLPWRADPGQFAEQFSVGFAGLMSWALNVPGNWSGLRPALDAYNRTAAAPWHGPLIMGEYSTFGGCDSQPTRLLQTQEGALGDAALQIEALQDSARPATGYPIIGTDHFALDGVEGACGAWDTIWVNSSSNWCASTRDNTAWVGAEGVVLRQLWQLSGAQLPVSASNVAQIAVQQVSYQQAFTLPSIQEVAYRDGSTLRLAVVNFGLGAPVTSTVQVSGATVTAIQSSRTVAAPPGALNTESAPNTISEADTPATLTGGSISLTLPPFSITLLTLTVA